MKVFQRNLRCIFVGLFALLSFLFFNCQQSSVLPNIVLIYIDDMGYADIGSFGAESYQTPHLDKMASEGMKFSDFYVSQAVCSASRASLLTGCYSNRVSILGALNPHARHGLNDAEVTIAELLKQKDYATAIFGKWHLGHREKFLPASHGFDEYFGLPYSNDMWPDHPAKRLYPELPLIEGTETIQTLKEQSMLTTWFTERSVKFIEKNKERPFFLYLAHSMVHVPLFVSDKFKGKSGQGLYGDVVMEIDWSVGEVMETLQRLGIDDNTLVIFTSDNGPWLSYGTHGGSALPLREGKGTAWEGGQRVPTLMRWPGKIPAQTTCSTPAMTIDILPTIAEITGTTLPDHPIDGKSILPLLRGDENAQSPQEAYYFYYGQRLNALRSGKWKLHLPHSYTTLSGREGGRDGKPVPYDIARTDTVLYDLENDISETTDVKDVHPEVARRLAKLAAEMQQKLGDEGISGSEIRKPGFIDGYITEKRQVTHQALGKPITLTHPYSPKYTGGGNNALVDGIRATSNFHDGSWQGFEEDDLLAVIDLGSATPINSITIGLMKDVYSWIFLPEYITYEISDDGENFQTIAEIPDDAFETEEWSAIREMHSEFENVTTRYLRVRAKSVGRCPEWHPGAGGKAWVFVDEIIVK